MLAAVSPDLTSQARAWLHGDLAAFWSFSGCTFLASSRSA